MRQRLRLAKARSRAAACRPDHLPDDLARGSINACNASWRIRPERHVAYERLMVLPYHVGVPWPIVGTHARLLMPLHPTKDRKPPWSIRGLGDNRGD